MIVRNMGLKLLLCVVSMGFASAAFADGRKVLTPTNQRNEEAHPLYSGAKYKYVTTSGETFVSSGPAVIYGLAMSTGAVTSFAILKDTDVANGSGSQALPRIPFSTATLDANNLGGLHFPIRVNKGIVISIQSVAVGEELSVLYSEIR